MKRVIGLLLLQIFPSLVAASEGKKFEDLIDCSWTMDKALAAAQSVSDDVRTSRSKFPTALFVAIEDYHFYLIFEDKNTMSHMIRRKHNMIVREKKNISVTC